MCVCMYVCVCVCVCVYWVDNVEKRGKVRVCAVTILSALLEDTTYVYMPMYCTLCLQDPMAVPRTTTTWLRAGGPRQTYRSQNQHTRLFRLNSASSYISVSLT